MSSLSAPRAGLASLYAAMLPPPPVPEAVVDVDAIAADAYREGLAAGITEAEAALAPVRATLTAAAKAFAAAMVVDPDALREIFTGLVSALARAVVGAELRTNPEVIARLIDTALSGVEPAADVIVRVHPDDAVHLDRPVTIDLALTRGTVIVDSPGFVIRDGLDTRLAALLDGIA